MKKDAIAAQALREAGKANAPDFRGGRVIWPLPTAEEVPNWEFACLQAGLVGVEPHNHGTYYHYKIATADEFNIFVELNARSDSKHVDVSDVQFAIRDRREGQIPNVWLRHVQALMIAASAQRQL